jgi:hypothetical protein
MKNSYSWQNTEQKEYIEKDLVFVTKHHGKRVGEFFKAKVFEHLENFSKNDLGIDSAIESAESDTQSHFDLNYLLF